MAPAYSQLRVGVTIPGLCQHHRSRAIVLWLTLKSRAICVPRLVQDQDGNLA